MKGDTRLLLRGHEITGPLALDGEGTVYVGSLDWDNRCGHALRALDSSGRELWQQPLDVPRPCAPVVDAGSVYCSDRFYANNPALVRFSMATGHLLGELPVRAWDGVVAAPGGERVAPAGEKGLVTLGPRLDASPYFSGGHVKSAPAFTRLGQCALTATVTDERGVEEDVFSLRAKSGREWARFSLAGCSDHSPVVSTVDGSIAVRGEDTLVLLDQNGVEQFRVTVEGRWNRLSDAPAFGPDGSLYWSDLREIHRRSPDGTRSSLRDPKAYSYTSTSFPVAPSFAKDGRIFIAAKANTGVVLFVADGDLEKFERFRTDFDKGVPNHPVVPADSGLWVPTSRGLLKVT